MLFAKLFRLFAKNFGQSPLNDRKSKRIKLGECNKTTKAKRKAKVFEMAKNNKCQKTAKTKAKRKAKLVAFAMI